MRDVSADRVRNFERSKSRLPKWGLIFENLTHIIDVRRGTMMSEIGLHVTSPRSRIRRLAERRRKSARQSLSSKDEAHDRLTSAAESQALSAHRRPHSFLESPGGQEKLPGQDRRAQDLRVGENRSLRRRPPVTKTPGFEFSQVRQPRRGRNRVLVPGRNPCLPLEQLARIPSRCFAEICDLATLGPRRRCSTR